MWDLLPTDEEKMIVASVREYLEREMPIERLRPKAARCDLARIQNGMAELGWYGVGLPETVGGSGLGLVAEALVQRECGRFLVSLSNMATVLAAHVAYHGNDFTLAGELVAGKTAVALAVLSAPSNTDTGVAYALDWSAGDPLLAWSDKGMGLFDSDAFTEVQPDECVDDSVKMHTGVLALRKPRLWIDAGQVSLGLRAQVLLAAGLTGIAEHACDLTVEYAKVREQFGQMIGSFQAVKHRCADMVVRARLAWYQTALACLKIETGTVDGALQAAAAKITAAQAAHENGRAAIQLHGGIGFQSECDAHWFMKRSHLYDQAGGSMLIQARHIANFD